MSGAGAALAGRARRALPYAALALGLALVYAPVLRSSALFNDDYPNFVEPPPKVWIIGAAGRPVQYVLTFLAHRLLAASPGDPRPLRAICFGLSLALALSIWAAVRRGLGTWGGVALVLFACSLPTYLVTFGWLSVATNLPAFLAAAGAYATGYLLLGRARSLAARIALGAATVVLVAFASLTYQIAAGLPLALVVYHLLFEREEREGGSPVRRAVVVYVLMGAGLVLSLVTLKVVLRVTGIPIADRAQGALASLASVRGLKLPLRIFDANFAMHYYWWGWLTREAAIVLGLALTVVIVRVAWRETRAGAPARRDRLARWLLVLAALFAAGMLFALDASRELRSKPFLTLLVLFLVVYGLGQTRAWARLPRRGAVVAAVVLLTMWSGRSTLADGLYAYSELETAEVRAALARAAPGTLRHVHVVQPERRCFSAPCYGAFEFQLKLASAHDWVPRGLVTYVLAQLGRAGERPEITYSRAAPDDPAAVVVDLAALERRLYAERGEVLDLDRFWRRKDLRLADVAGLSGCWLRISPRADVPPGQARAGQAP